MPSRAGTLHPFSLWAHAPSGQNRLHVLATERGNWIWILGIGCFIRSDELPEWIWCRNFQYTTKKIGKTKNKKMDFRIFSQPSAEPEEKRFLRPEGISCWNECFLESRRRVFKALLLKYHPDKNPGNEAVSSITFQFVMKQKEWFSVAAWSVNHSVFKKISRCAAKIKVFFGIESQQQKTTQQRPRRRNPPCEISATSGPKYVFRNSSWLEDIFVLARRHICPGWKTLASLLPCARCVALVTKKPFLGKTTSGKEIMWATEAVAHIILLPWCWFLGHRAAQKYGGTFDHTQKLWDFFVLAQDTFCVKQQVFIYLRIFCQ